MSIEMRWRRGGGSYASANSEIIRETSKDSNITFTCELELVEREARREEEKEKGGEDREEAAVA